MQLTDFFTVFICVFWVCARNTETYNKTLGFWSEEKFAGRASDSDSSRQARISL